MPYVRPFIQKFHISQIIYNINHKYNYRKYNHESFCFEKRKRFNLRTCKSFLCFISNLMSVSFFLRRRVTYAKEYWFYSIFWKWLSKALVGKLPLNPNINVININKINVTTSAWSNGSLRSIRWVRLSSTSLTLGETLLV